MTALDEAVAAIYRSGDAGAALTTRVVVAEFGPDAATRILTDELCIPTRARLSVRLRDVLEQRGGSVTHQHLLVHLAGVLDEPACAVRATIDDEVAAGHLELTWADAADDLRSTLTVVRPGMSQ